MFNFLLHKLCQKAFPIDEPFLPCPDGDPEEPNRASDIGQELKKLGKWQLSVANKLDLLLSKEGKKDPPERGLLKEVLPLIDGLETILAATPEGALSEGLRILQRKSCSVLEKHEIFPIPTMGCLFDPASHKAMGIQPVMAAENNKIVQELKKGYLYKGEILRHSEVIVGKFNSERNPNG
jgi:hypothetical protein